MRELPIYQNCRKVREEQLKVLCNTTQKIPATLKLFFRKTLIGLNHHLRRHISEHNKRPELSHSVNNRQHSLSHCIKPVLVSMHLQHTHTDGNYPLWFVFMDGDALQSTFSAFLLSRHGGIHWPSNFAMRTQTLLTWSFCDRICFYFSN